MQKKIEDQNVAIAKFISFSEAVLNMPEPNLSKGFLEGKSKVITELWSKVDSMHDIILEGTTWEEREGSEYFKKNEHERAFYTYDKVVVMIQKKLDKCNKPLINPQSTIQLPENILVHNKTNIKLKPIPIPNFSGNFKEWITFSNMFQSLVHDNNEFTNLQKFHYLKSSLSGEAERLLNQFNMREEEYEAAYKTIKDRYHNEVILVDTHIIAIIAQTNLTNETASGLKELFDVTTENIHALNSLQIATDNWDPLLLILLVPKLDTTSKRLWDLTLKPKVRPTLKEFLEFLEKRFHALSCQQNIKLTVDVTGNTKIQYDKKQENHNFNDYNQGYNNAASTFKRQNERYVPKVHQSFHNSTMPAQNSCPLGCEQGHRLVHCDRFRHADIRKRHDLVTCAKVCKNCLFQHSGRCPQQPNCRTCSKFHHTFLHLNQGNLSNRNILTTTSRNDQQQQFPQQDPNIFVTQAEMNLNSHHAHTHQMGDQLKTISNDTIAWDEPVLLATAIILIKSLRDGCFYPFRCLLDQASEASYISETVVQLLGLKKTPIVASLSGLGGIITASARDVVEFQVGSKYIQDLRINVQAPVVSKVTNPLPSTVLKSIDWEHIQGLKLADPEFHKPGKIDVLLGAPVYGYLLLPGLIKKSPDVPVAQNTEFGWILSGGTRQPITRHTISSFHLRVEIDDQVRRFFEQEELPTERILTQEEVECEKFFKKTFRRNEEGRCVVALPFKENPNNLGSSKGQAISRLTNLESRLTRNNELKKEYTVILNEYQALNHTSELGELAVMEENESSSYYLPHHPVFKPDSTTTKTRIVFDASAKTTTGRSLNDLLMVGPTLQQDLTSIIIRWRFHKIVFSADIAKMYRQVLVRQQDRKYQRFLYRKDATEPIQVYEHNMVTFGVASATYLAVAALRQIAIEGKEEYPEASEIILNDFYMDDGMSGSDSIEDGIRICRDLKNLLAGGKFELRKFISNSTKLLENIPEEDRELKLPLEINIDNNVKTLGIRYYPATDMFQFKVNLETSSEWPTKRSLLSETSRLFDPLGWLAPVIIRAKIVFQELWQAGLTWDQKLPEQIADKWLTFRNELKHLENVKIKRWTGWGKDIKSLEIHGFGDASEKAYSAVVYSRVVKSDNTIHVTMLSSKTRVAPLKPTTLPRLELCGAVLVANLMNVIGKALNVDKSKMHAWSDSTVTLGWLKGEPSKFKTYVANRVVEAHNYLNMDHWHHIEGKNNPADCASRGIPPTELENHDLWWNGPKCLREQVTSWNQTDLIIPQATLELKSKILKSHVVIVQEETLLKYIKDFSDLNRLIRLTALQLRFINNTRTPNNRIINSNLTVAELQNARKLLIRLSQEIEFSRELSNLRTKKGISSKSKLLSLNPFIDEDGLLRVGGRLEYSNLPYDRRHPIILADGPLKDLIITDAHFRSMHGGTKLTMNLVKESYWIIRLRQNIKKHIIRCVKCFRFKATASQQIMGALPRARIIESNPFTHTGVDYAGPFNIRASNVKAPPIRIKKIIVNGEVVKAIPRIPTYKGYIALFVCFATKAIHLEVVSDMTTETFLAALTRFTSRRSFPRHMYSYNGSTFIGAKNILADEFEKSILDYSKVAAHLAKDGCQWHFIPPKASHYGGLYEAGVKSMKHHLKRVIRDTTLTFEELTTVTAQIETCLNSRPLCPITDEPDDLEVLTPGHFLVGRPLIARPSGKAGDHKGNLRDRWQLIQKFQKDIWTAWNKEYLSQLQQRNKWRTQKPNLKKGDIVLLKEDDMPPTKWPLARILDVFPSEDKNVRVARIRARLTTKTGEYERPITKLCPLPTIDNENSTEN